MDYPFDWFGMERCSNPRPIFLPRHLEHPAGIRAIDFLLDWSRAEQCLSILLSHPLDYLDCFWRLRGL